MLNKRVRLICYLIISGVLLLIGYPLLHELGHTVIGVLCNGKISDFNFGLKNAHVAIEDAKYNNISLPLMNVFGALLPFIVSFIIIIFYKKIAKTDFLKLLILMITICIPGSLIAWVIIPFFYVYGISPVGDDVTQFLNNSNVSPILVSSSALILIFLMLFISLKVQKVHVGYIKILKDLKNNKSIRNE